MPATYRHNRSTNNGNYLRSHRKTKEIKLDTETMQVIKKQGRNARSSGHDRSFCVGRNCKHHKQDNKKEKQLQLKQELLEELKDVAPSNNEATAHFKDHKLKQTYDKNSK